MTVTNTILTTLAAGALIGVTLTVLAGRLTLWRKPMVLAVLKSGQTIRGALLARRLTYVVLGGAELLEAGKATRIDGNTHIDRANIEWLQEPGR